MLCEHALCSVLARQNRFLLTTLLGPHFFPIFSLLWLTVHSAWAMEASIVLPGDGGHCFDGLSDLDSVLSDNPVPWPCTTANGKRASHLEGFSLMSCAIQQPSRWQAGRRRKDITGWCCSSALLGAKALCFLSSDPLRHCCLAAGPWNCSLQGDPKLLPAW